MTAWPARGAAVSALVAALILLGVQLVLQLLSLLLTATAFNSGAPLNYLISLGFGFLTSVVFRLLPFVIGVFLVLWLLTPISAGLRTWPVILRSLLAAAGGALAMLFVSLGAGLLGSLSVSEGRAFGWARAILGAVATGFDSSVGYAVATTLSTVVSLLPLAVLAGILSWLWLRSRPEAAPTASGAEV